MRSLLIDENYEFIGVLYARLRFIGVAFQSLGLLGSHSDCACFVC